MVVEINLELSDLLKYRGSYKTSNRFKSTLYKHSFITNEGKFETTPKKVRTPEFKKKTNLSIGGFLAGQHRSPLIICFSFQACQAITRSLNPEAFSLLIFCASSVDAVCGKDYFCVLQFIFLRQKVARFGQDQGPLVQATKRVEMPLVIPTVIDSQRLSHNRLPSSMYSPWHPPWWN